ncbi:MAG: ATP synthase F1 subunit epsilon [Candidatus Zambryskibacteria bacterium CG10_big_fil_rev_8_21_14_0_10_42_12]|uniref:ATP synthase epsilon chain n=1 Tax=Candidatus Zambryskibacteria bacterium CG10_big_fil_rev_8_21_14_0_10_42_12 TaxID=1975115 RepID=A0A2H0QVN9_9BACT|nr:MAG: ATP synthase F1 subunit epsilon [Candidatus Zambryskibacteria bacterium CG10_big_fil_rev_8_21_14_0_10_42_12]
MSNNQNINTKIITPTGVVFSGDTESINIMTSAGEITILPNHAPLISKIDGGHAKLRTEDGEQIYAIGEGVLEIRQNSEVIILVSNAETATSA